MNNKIITNAISAVLALGLTSTSALAHAESAKKMQASMEPTADTERCYGIAKAGKNDCGNASHSCGGEAKVDGDKNEWVAVPNGLCNKIVGSRTTPEKTG